MTRDLTEVRARDQENARLTAQIQAHAEDLEELVRARTHELENANNELRQANEALETFAQSISHDLRGPLRTIQGFADILLDEHAASLNEEGRDYLSRVAAAARRLDELVQNLLAYSRVARTDAKWPSQRVSWDRLVESVKRDLELELARTRAQIEVTAPLGDVVGHREALTLVLQNLLTNAIKFVESGVQPCIRVWSERHGHRVRLNIRDNGIGVSVAEQSQIFRPFERLHASAVYSGTGLGLAIVAQAVSRMGGSYGVSSDGRTGSCFWVELPAPPDEPEH